MKNFFSKFYIVGRGGYGKQLSVMFKSDGIINQTIFVDDKLKLNLKKFFNINDKINFNICLGEPDLREKIFKFLKR
jgi:hypothetical protein